MGGREREKTNSNLVFSTKFRSPLDCCIDCHSRTCNLSSCLFHLSLFHLFPDSLLPLALTPSLGHFIRFSIIFIYASVGFNVIHSRDKHRAKLYALMKKIIHFIYIFFQVKYHDLKIGLKRLVFLCLVCKANGSENLQTE